MNRRVLIVGASRGLGLCFAKQYLSQNDIVYMGVRDASCAAVTALQAEYGEKVIAVPIEVRSTESVTAAADNVGKTTDYLDVVICNAAIHSPTSFLPIEETNLDECLDVMDVNAVGPMRVAKAFLRFLRADRGARIINITSESGSVGICERDRQFGYCMSKSALNMGSKLLQNLLAPNGIKVLLVHPGWMRTDMGGSNAFFDPMDSAAKLLAVFDRFAAVDAPMFVDFDGEELPW